MDVVSSCPINFGTGRVSMASDFGSGRVSMGNGGEESRRRTKKGELAVAWLKKRSTAAKIGLAAATVLLAVVTLKHAVHNRSYLFIACEAVHAAGLLVLAYKLTKHKTCSGLSSKTQELTALFLAVRLISGTFMSIDIYTALDFMNFVSSIWVIYMIRFKLKDTYVKSLDNFNLYHVILPALVLSIFVYPHARSDYLVHAMWAFGVYLEAFSVLPQLLMIQNSKVIEPFTAHYVFALGISRFIGFVHWIIQVYETRGRYILMAGDGNFWFMAASMSEIIQSFILADFCYYYVKSMVQGRLKIPV